MPRHCRQTTQLHCTYTRSRSSAQWTVRWSLQDTPWDWTPRASRARSRTRSARPCWARWESRCTCRCTRRSRTVTCAFWARTWCHSRTAVCSPWELRHCSRGPVLRAANIARLVRVPNLPFSVIINKHQIGWLHGHYLIQHNYKSIGIIHCCTIILVPIIEIIWNLV